MSGRVASEGVLVRKKKGMSLYKGNFVTLVASALWRHGLLWGIVWPWLLVTQLVIYPFPLFLDWDMLLVEFKKTKGAVEDKWWFRTGWCRKMQCHSVGHRFPIRVFVWDSGCAQLRVNWVLVCYQLCSSKWEICRHRTLDEDLSKFAIWPIVGGCF